MIEFIAANGTRVRIYADTEWSSFNHKDLIAWSPSHRNWQIVTGKDLPTTIRDKIVPSGSLGLVSRDQWFLKVMGDMQNPSQDWWTVPDAIAALIYTYGQEILRDHQFQLRQLLGIK